ncbi:hypothetical protein GIB67_029553 [Kingdonia uniflora]|uniref:Exoribonuclease phosphorolytic domain-containing protein n=1 Tax=Kingdonia uniflora TaxID=39325 RepID=A0A7J7NY75_9MAGN|nr:hypothetical protein GIB67_029553 [Kingdonia uniflora]
MANFSTGDRMRKQKGDRRSTEISLVIRQTVEACILTHLMPRSQIDIFVQVLQADGGTRFACINAASLALADTGIPMCDLVTSCKGSAGGTDGTVGILAKLDKVTPIQMDAKLPMDTFENVMQLTIEGCKAIENYIREVIQEILRTSSIILFTFNEAVEDVELEGFLIPKGWKDLPLFRAIHHSEEIYPEHEKFNPSRFEAQPRPNTYLPFGIGGHSCPRSELAKLEMLVLHHLK